MLTQQQTHSTALNSPVLSMRHSNLRMAWRATAVLAILLLARDADAWGGGGEVDTSIYGDSLSRDWLTDGSTISMKLEGCMWAVTESNEDMGCMEDSSNDGTEYWYMMANCRRAQVVYNLYTGAGCGTFKESVRVSRVIRLLVLFREPQL